MPRYDYRCSACGDTYEKREGFDAPAVQACPACSGTARRLLTSPAIVFKGSGWYVNDSRKGSADGDSSRKGSTDGGGDDSSTKTSTKTESTSTTSETASTPAASDGGSKTEKTSS